VGLTLLLQNKMAEYIKYLQFMATIMELWETYLERISCC
jgi:hypothetical protein